MQTVFICLVQYGYEPGDDFNYELKHTVLVKNNIVHPHNKNEVGGIH
jgi:hypothetical protein